MYHNLIPVNQRQQYLELLENAERLLPLLARHPEHFSIIRRAASAVRGSDTVLARMKPPLTAQQRVALSQLIQKSRAYVDNFWPQNKAQGKENPEKPAITGKTEKHEAVPPSPNPSPAVMNVVQVAPRTAVQQPAQAPAEPNTPQTLAQYVHTLSHKLQCQALVLPMKYAELNDLHETLDRLVRSQLSSDGQSLNVSDKPHAREYSYYANKIDVLVRTIDAFWNRVHAERKALAGEPATPEYMQFLQDEEKKYPMDDAERAWGDYTKAEIEQLAAKVQNDTVPLFPTPDAPCAQQLIYARQERNKKLLRRSPQHTSERAVRERVLAMNELHEWGILLTKKQWEVLQSLDIDVPKEYIDPFVTMTDEERRAHKQERERKYYHENKPDAVKMKVGLKQRHSKTQDNPYKS